MHYAVKMSNDKFRTAEYVGVLLKEASRKLGNFDGTLEKTILISRTCDPGREASGTSVELIARIAREDGPVFAATVVGRMFPSLFAFLSHTRVRLYPPVICRAIR